MRNYLYYHENLNDIAAGIKNDTPILELEHLKSRLQSAERGISGEGGHAILSLKAWLINRKLNKRLKNENLFIVNHS